MNIKIPYNIYEKERISDQDFDRLSTFVTHHYGIKLPKVKKVMVEGRLQKRLRATGVGNFNTYLELIFSEQGKAEIVNMIDAISTNKTDFFRESAHFDYLITHLLPTYLEVKNKKNISIWSAASSTGEEIYTLAMVFEEYNSKQEFSGKIDYKILGTDISVEAIKTAKSAVYAYDRIKDVPLELRDKYFLRSKDRSANKVRVIPTLRSKATFQRLNLMDNQYTLSGEFDIIFCRNVLIYFDKETQEAVINKLCQKLRVGGLFFLGHSESIIGKNVPLEQLKPTIYKRI